MTTLTINRKPVEVRAEPDTPLLWVLRGELQMTGTKFGCGMALCGACTVHVDGEPTRSCVTPISAAGAREVTTIEGLSGPQVAALKAAWIEMAWHGRTLGEICRQLKDRSRNGDRTMAQIIERITHDD